MKTIIKLCALALCLSTHVYAASNHLPIEHQQPAQSKKLRAGMPVTANQHEQDQPVLNVLDEHDQVVDTLNVPLSFIHQAAKVGDDIYAMGSIHLGV